MGKREEVELQDVRAALEKHEHRVDDLLTERDRWETSEQSAKRQMDSIESRLQGDLDNLKQKRDQDLTEAQNTHKRAMAEVEEKLRRSEASVTEFHTKTELLENKQRWEAREMERQSSI